MNIAATLDKLTLVVSSTGKEELRKELSAYLNHLLLNDFAALIQILYRSDVSEEKLKRVLQQNKEADAGDLLTALLLQRHEEKTVTRKKNSSNNMDTGEEQW